MRLSDISIEIRELLVEGKSIEFIVKKLNVPVEWVLHEEELLIHSGG